MPRSRGRKSSVRRSRTRQVQGPSADPSFRRATENDWRALALGRELQQSKTPNVRALGEKLSRAAGTLLQRKEQRWHRAQAELETRIRGAPASVLLGLCVALLAVTSGLGCQVRNKRRLRHWRQLFMCRGYSMRRRGHRALHSAHRLRIKGLPA